MKKILITGKNGYIASSLYSSLKNVYDVTVIGRDELDLSNSTKVNSWFNDKKFDVVIHTAIQGGHRLYKDDMSITDTNLKIYYNLLDNQKNYDKFINIGSGAEIFSINTPYGLSKHVIRNSVLHIDNFYNIRAFAVFDENERNTRFIKTNILNYINHKDMQLHQDKKMDFFYMKDFVSVIMHYIDNDNLPKEIDCTYLNSPRLSYVLSFINSLSDYQVDIIHHETDMSDEHYIGNHTNLGIKYIGMENGIQQVYNKLCKK
jgi:nucleoside-diphosphate-sugar epimerase